MYFYVSWKRWNLKHLDFMEPYSASSSVHRAFMSIWDSPLHATPQKERLIKRVDTGSSPDRDPCWISPPSTHHSSKQQSKRRSEETLFYSHTCGWWLKTCAALCLLCCTKIHGLKPWRRLVWYCYVLVWSTLRIPIVEVILPCGNLVIPRRKGCVSWECLWCSQRWPHHWFVVLLSPLAWPWPEKKQTHTLAQKAWLRPLTSSLLGNVIVPPKLLLDRHFIAFTVAFWALKPARITMYSLSYRPQSSCDKRISCSHI